MFLLLMGLVGGMGSPSWGDETSLESVALQYIGESDQAQDATSEESQVSTEGEEVNVANDSSEEEVSEENFVEPQAADEDEESEGVLAQEEQKEITIFLLATGLQGGRERLLSRCLCE